MGTLFFMMINNLNLIFQKIENYLILRLRNLLPTFCVGCMFQYPVAAAFGYKFCRGQSGRTISLNHILLFDILNTFIGLYKLEK